MPRGLEPAPLPPSQSQCPCPHHHQLPGLLWFPGVALSHSPVPAGPVEGFWGSVSPARTAGRAAGRAALPATSPGSWLPASKENTSAEGAGPSTSMGTQCPQPPEAMAVTSLACSPVGHSQPPQLLCKRLFLRCPLLPPRHRVRAFSSDIAPKFLPHGSGCGWQEMAIPEQSKS